MRSYFAILKFDEAKHPRDKEGQFTESAAPKSILDLKPAASVPQAPDKWKDFDGLAEAAKRLSGMKYKGTTITGEHGFTFEKQGHRVLVKHEGKLLGTSKWVWTKKGPQFNVGGCTPTRITPPMANTVDLRTYVTLEKAFVRRLQRSWDQKSAPIYAAITQACLDHRWDEARRLVPDLDMAEVGTENREWITYMLLSCAVFGANTISKRKPSFVGAGTFDTFLKQTTNNLLQYLEYGATAQIQEDARQLIAKDEAATKALPKVAFDPAQPRDTKGRWTVTGTPEFKEWFGNSKVVDDSGKPLVVYHGSTKMFDQFDPAKALTGNIHSLTLHVPLYFATNKPEVAETYTLDQPGANVVPLYMSLQRPLVIDVGGEDFTVAASEINDRLPVYRNAAGQEFAEYRDALIDRFGEDEWQGRDLTELLTSKEHARLGELQRAADADRTEDYRVGKQYDGIIIRNVIDQAHFGGGVHIADVYVAFQPTQIKSAIGNRGTFDPNDSRITKFDPTQPRDEDGKWTKGGSTIANATFAGDEPARRWDAATTPPKKGESLVVFRIEYAAGAGLAGRNAGNAEAIRAHLLNNEEYGVDGMGTILTAYRVTLTEDMQEGYVSMAGGEAKPGEHEGAPEGVVGRGAYFMNGQGYVFPPSGKGFKAVPLASIPVSEVDLRAKDLSRHIREKFATQKWDESKHPRDKEGQFTYHGTAREKVESILKEGLRVAHSGDIWPDYAHKDKVYVTTEEEAARIWAQETVSRISDELRDQQYDRLKEGERIPKRPPIPDIAIIKIRIPADHLAQLAHDENVPRFREDTKQFTGDIPPEWIVGAKIGHRISYEAEKLFEWTEVPLKKAASEDRIVYVALVLAEGVLKWDESKHPRDKQGQFAESPGGVEFDEEAEYHAGQWGGAAYEKLKAVRLREEEAKRALDKAVVVRSELQDRLLKTYTVNGEMMWGQLSDEDQATLKTIDQAKRRAAIELDDVRAEVYRQAKLVQVEVVTNIATSVAEDLGVDPSVIDVVDKELRDFKVGEVAFKEAGHFSPSTGRIELNVRAIPFEYVRAATAHELDHLMYNRLKAEADFEFAQYLKKALTVTEAAHTDWYRERFAMGKSPSGRTERQLKPEYVEEFTRNYPASAVLAQLSEGKFFTGIEQRMVNENGHSAYAKSYWAKEALVNTGYEAAIMETSAELTRWMVAPGSWHEGHDPSPASRWVQFTKSLHQWYRAQPKATA